MKKANLLATTATAMTFAFTNATNAAEVIDSQKYARNVANHIAQNCSQGADETCLYEIMNTTYSIAGDLSTYIKEVTLPIMPLESGMAQGDLLEFCETPMNATSGKKYSSLTNFTDAAFNTIESCIDSIRRAESAIGIEFQPTAVNTIANLVNCVTGKECVTQDIRPPSL